MRPQWISESFCPLYYGTYVGNTRISKSAMLDGALHLFLPHTDATSVLKQRVKLHTRNTAVLRELLGNDSDCVCSQLSKTVLKGMQCAAVCAQPQTVCNELCYSPSAHNVEMVGSRSEECIIYRRQLCARTRVIHFNALRQMSNNERNAFFFSVILSSFRRNYFRGLKIVRSKVQLRAFG